MRTSTLSRLLGALIALVLLSNAGGAFAFIDTASANHSLCSDGRDNDYDGRIDYPEDQDCLNADDNSESHDEGVFVTLTDERDSVAAGDALQYIITLKQQRDPVALVDVALHVPAQNSIVSTSDDGTISHGSIVWRKVAVFRNNVRRLYVHVVVSPNVQNSQLLVARVTADGAQATDTTMVNGRPIPYVENQLKVSITDNRDNARPGDTLDYRVNVFNPEPNGTAVHVRVKVPAALTVTDMPGASRIGDEIVWQDVGLNGNQSKTFTFRAVVHSQLPKSYPIQVVARAGNVVASDRTIVGGGTGPYSLFASITDNASVVGRGDLLTYVIHIDNASGRLERDTSMNAGLPLYTEFVSANDGGQWDGKNVRWLHMDVAPGGTRDLSFTVRVRSDAPDGTLLRATAFVQGFVVNDTTQVGGSIGYNTPSFPPVYGGGVTRTVVPAPVSYVPYTYTDQVVLPQTGIEDFFGPVENLGQFLSPISTAANGSGLPLMLWLAVIIGGVAAGGVIGKKITA